jgi:hypothetical protein
MSGESSRLLVIHLSPEFSPVEKMTTPREIRQRFTRLATAGQHVWFDVFIFCLPPTICCGRQKTNGRK